MSSTATRPQSQKPTWINERMRGGKIDLDGRQFTIAQREYPHDEAAA
jgi:hypothetical protein